MVPNNLVSRAGLPLALALSACGAAAQTTLREVVVSAARTEQAVQDALPATTLITRREIEQAQTPDLPTLLRRLTGGELAQTGQQGSVAGVFLRGAEPRHTLVLVDGVPINNLNFGLPAIEHIPLADVERIEVVRGNVSSLYGSAAIGGVIQIFTRQPTATPFAALTVQGGSRGLVQVDATGSVKLASGTGLRASAEGLRDRGFNAIRQEERPGTNPDRDGYRRHAASLAVTQDLGAHSIGLKLRDARGRVDFDNEFGPATQRDSSRFVEQVATLDGRFRLTPTLRVDAAFTRAVDKLDADEAAFPFFVDSRSDGAQVGAEWQAAPGQRVTAGLEHTRQHITSDTAYERDRRTVDGARIGYALDAGKHQLQLNARHDRYSDFGSANTWLAAYGYQLTPAWRASVSASTGFRAPSFNDLFFPFGIGNPDLRPERVRSTELALQYVVGGQEVRATLFQNRFHDLIGSDSAFHTINVGRARNRGLELAYAGRVLEYALRAGVTAQDPRDLDDDTRLVRRARVFGHVGVTRERGPWQWGGNLRFSGDREDRFQGTPVRLGGYGVLDLTAAYTVSPQVKVFGRIENVFDHGYETAFGYRQAGRGAFVGVRWQPGTLTP
ncbi:TonB-dependent receptor domain-containing protein [Ramlibacter alkalitolerans]|uniref:TonB-dependent receptor n=1 Tax=Ramlibacter alkalitolerans TaxID=2039631 RepID=A0ABS1JW64_9BURK|nr:TonB-dependent receptor [Ramlibacter alkalitolerans]MBL0428459.1 TonB-dependent receptor [Ramlibacter alkalitolerans]